MGDPLTPNSGEYETATHECTCWNVGNPFALPQPKYVKVLFVGIKYAGAFPTLTKYTWYLKHTAPCGYSKTFGDWTCSVFFGQWGGGPGSGANLMLQNIAKMYFNSHYVNRGCITDFENSLRDPWGNPYGGWAYVSWGPGINEESYNSQWSPA